LGDLTIYTIIPGIFFPLGYAEFRLFCPLMLYSVLVQASMMVAALIFGKDRLEYIKRENPDFGQVMMEATFLVAVCSIFLSAVANLPASGGIARYISSWADYQVTKLYKL
jgi:hypothetical protein